MPRPLSTKTARAIIDTSELVKAPDWADTRIWHVISSGRLLVVIEPSYRGGRRSGWRWRLAGSSTWSSRAETNREKAAAAGLGAWQRWITSKEQP
ncbi:hypothetical protein [Streptomyces sp. NRRL F-5135]|uniref:hypothetical protein n=1 Tax=Streptomyces sp. NRRL F-5135 TaxID=1463858 RepID=UPI0004C6852F|nr:hypothetical protein [Streptomyces sp. NRRL F-5135]